MSIEGAVLTLMDIDALKAEVKELRVYAESIVETLRQPLIVLDGNLRVVTTNAAFYDTFKESKDKTEGRFIYSLGDASGIFRRCGNSWNEFCPRRALSRVSK